MVVIWIAHTYSEVRSHLCDWLGSICSIWLFGVSCVDHLGITQQYHPSKNVKKNTFWNFDCGATDTMSCDPTDFKTSIKSKNLISRLPMVIYPLYTEYDALNFLLVYLSLTLFMFLICLINLLLSVN